MRKLTLDRAWKLCLEQWKWIIEQLDKGSKEDIEVLKVRWLKLKGLATSPCAECFFCEYAKQNNGRLSWAARCVDCPAVLVSPVFSCQKKSYHYKYHPRAFYKKLLTLNKKRLEAK